MLFDRFVFVLYILLCYTWFLLGMIYESSIKYFALVILVASLSSIVVVTLFQLQRVLNVNRMSTADKWSTITWCMVHISISILFCVDGLEMANIMVILGLAGFLMTMVIVVVGTCACYVIMREGSDWIAHLHLTCVSFWVVVQYMVVRLPDTSLHYITTVPIVCMAGLRLYEMWEYDHKYVRLTIWLLCIALHIVRDSGGIEQAPFYWGTCSTASLMALTHPKKIALILTLPFLFLSVLLYMLVSLVFCKSVRNSFNFILQLYNEHMSDPQDIILPLDVGDEDWSSHTLSQKSAI